ncbi:phage major capsid protein [Vagococcus salmoninarum]|uniref:Phage major capsid protein n=1 Tax=Vagococcus salmoninarum TaxID=2739 RepID=A0A429ZSL5_9ENTE|nr:phage major capsid protein [Vagococcus salmoninarum]RST96653.1 phage major capsid protein [Vagococcus salmoninarum]
MALKQIMLNKKINQKRDLLATALEAEKALELRATEIEAAIDEAVTDEEIKTVEEQIDEIEKELDEKKEEKATIQEDITALEMELETLENKEPSNDPIDEKRGGNKKMSKRTKEELIEKREAANEFLRTKGKVQRDNLTSDDVGVLIPKDVDYKPRKELDSTTDLSQFVTVFPVKNPSGTYQMQKRSKAKMHTVEELQQNPDLAKPEFIPVKWEVQTYRGMIAISQESIDDTEADLVGIVNTNADEQRENTSNDLITKQFQDFTKVEINAATDHIVDKLKEILNKKLKTGYDKSLIVTQSFFHILDTLKDKDGKYLLQPDITKASDGVIGNKKVHIVDDEQLQVNTGTAEAPVYNPQTAFIGDSKRAILMPKRAEISAKWADDKIYGEYVATGIRFGISKGDPDAGFFVQINGTVPEGTPDVGGA